MKQEYSFESESRLFLDFPSVDNPSEARKFIQIFENVFPAYNSYLNDIYFDYKFLHGKKSDIIIVEPTYTLEDTKSNVEQESIIDIPKLHIFPGEVIGEKGAYIKIPGRNKNARSEPMPIDTGLERMIKKGIWNEGENIGFYPLLCHNSIRAYSDGLVHLKLFNLDLDNYHNISEFERNHLKNVLRNRINQFIGHLNK